MTQETRELEAGDPRSLKEGRYRCLSVLGEGSMGRTFLAEDTRDGGRLAIKALYPSRLADWKDLELFKREATVLERVHHDLVPAYIDSFHEGEGEAVCYFLAQTWVDGVTLRDKLRSGHRFEPAEWEALARDLLGVLVYLHSLDPPVVHRDIKPENIVLRRADGRPTLVDFGAVREVVRLTMRGGSTIVGSYGYMSPEQLMGRAVPATDIYALGITLLECLTRQVPQDMHGEEAKQLVAQLNASEATKRILGRMCAPLLQDRYGSAQEVLEDLAGLTSGQLVHVARIESDISKRQKAKERALKKASSPGLHLGYIAVMTVIGMASLAGLYFMTQAVAMGFQGSVVVGGAVGAVGMVITLVMVGMRYVHDAWSPPQPDWLRSTAEVTKVERHINQENGYAYWEVHYDIRTKNGPFAYSRSLLEADVGKIEVGRKFMVWYPPGKPELHDAEDIRKGDMSAMRQLFDPRVVHTPE